MTVGRYVIRWFGLDPAVLGCAAMLRAIQRGVVTYGPNRISAHYPDAA